MVLAKINGLFVWIAIGILFYIVITQPQKISFYRKTNTLFDLNEMTFIPDDIRKKLKDVVNDKIIPALRTKTRSKWNSMTKEEKSKLFLDIDTYVNRAIDSINKADIDTLGSQISPPPMIQNESRKVVVPTSVKCPEGYERFGPNGGVCKKGNEIVTAEIECPAGFNGGIENGMCIEGS